MKKALIIAGYFLVFWILLPAGLIVASDVLDPVIFPRMELPGFLRPLGICVFICSLFLMLVAVIQFRTYSGTWPVSAFPPPGIIRKGLYKVWAHPIYLFVAVEAAGLAMMLKSPSFMFLLLPVFILAVAIYIIQEEKSLFKRFGQEYLNYRKIARIIVPLPFFWLRTLAFLPLFKILFHFRVYHKNKIPDPPLFVVAAHRCYLDPFFLSAALGTPVRYLSTYEMFRSKTKRKLFGFFGAIPKKRYKNDIRSLFLMDRALKEGYPVGIFPEGERSWTGEMQSFKPETLRLFRRYPHIPVLPVRIEGNYFAWPRWSPKMLRSKVSICFEDPVNVADIADNHLLEKEISSRIFPRPEVEAGYPCKKRNITGEISRLLYRCPGCFAFGSLKENPPQTLICRNCRQNFTIDNRFLISFDNGHGKKIQSITHLYKRIEIKEADADEWLQPEPQSAENGTEERAGIFSGQGSLFKEEGSALNLSGTGQFDLSAGGIRFQPAGEPVTLLLKDILSVMIESYYKLQIYTASGVLYQITLEAESVVKWRDMLVVLMKRKGLREPVTR